MQDKGVLMTAMVVLVACMVSLITAVAQKGAAQAPAAPQRLRLRPRRPVARRLQRRRRPIWRS